jgi:hypothetical protein
VPQRPCLRCGSLLRTGSYCARCQPSRFNKAKRGSGWQASRFRREVLAQTGGRCAVPGCPTPFDGVEAHHLGAGDAEGGVALCRRHHREAERRA